jgi:hypothetical protein
MFNRFIYESFLINVRKEQMRRNLLRDLVVLIVLIIATFAYIIS